MEINGIFIDIPKHFNCNFAHLCFSITHGGRSITIN